MATYAATFYYGSMQFTPSEKRQDGKGYRAVQFSGCDFEEAADAARAWLIENYKGPMHGTPDQILLIEQETSPRRFMTVPFRKAEDAAVIRADAPLHVSASLKRALEERGGGPFEAADEES